MGNCEICCANGNLKCIRCNKTICPDCMYDQDMCVECAQDEDIL